MQAKQRERERAAQHCYAPCIKSKKQNDTMRAKQRWKAAYCRLASYMHEINETNNSMRVKRRWKAAYCRPASYMHEINETNNIMRVKRRWKAAYPSLHHACTTSRRDNNTEELKRRLDRTTEQQPRLRRRGDWGVSVTHRGAMTACSGTASPNGALLARL